MLLPTTDNSNQSKLNQNCTLIITQNALNKISKETIITNFIKTINSSYKKNTTKTKIFYVKLEDDIIEKEIVNKEYTEYETKKKSYEQNKTMDEFSKME